VFYWRRKPEYSGIIQKGRKYTDFCGELSNNASFSQSEVLEQPGETMS
jgi:hypothetical protein